MEIVKWMRVVFVCSLVIVVNAQSDSCGGNSQVFSSLNLSSLPFDASSLQCTAVWTSYNYILRYKLAQNSTNTWSFLLSAPNRNGWVGMGFSTNGLMVGSSAIVGWVDQSGSKTVAQYYLGGQTPTQVVADQGSLNIVNNYKSIMVQGSTMFLAFQLQFSNPLGVQNVLYAIGPPSTIPTNKVLVQHADRVPTVFDFTTGTSSTSTSTDKLRRNHGILNIVGWGTLLPIGVIIARYFRLWDPAWFYLHIGVQISGFIIGVVGAALGFKLYNRLNSDVKTHRAIGIVILTIAGLQILGLFIRPAKESKKRKYWNWYHHWFGRFLFIFAVANIFYGIHLGGAGKKWNVGYGFDVGILVVVAVILESLMWIKWFRNPTETPARQYVYDGQI